MPSAVPSNKFAARIGKSLTRLRRSERSTAPPWRAESNVYGKGEGYRHSRTFSLGETSQFSPRIYSTAGETRDGQRHKRNRDDPSPFSFLFFLLPLFAPLRLCVRLLSLNTQHLTLNTSLCVLCVSVVQILREPFGKIWGKSIDSRKTQ
jgi:hypothetical protein